MNVFLKLRSNIELDGDVVLAERELKACFANVRPARSASEVVASLGLPIEFAQVHCRPSPPIGFLAEKPTRTYEWIARVISFVQEIWICPEPSDNLPLRQLPYLTKTEIDNKDYYCIVPLMALAEILTFTTWTSPDVTGILEVVRSLSSGDQPDTSPVSKAISRQSTSTPHVHGLHKYKAKFFPRMIRSLLVSKAPQPDLRSERRPHLLDPFLGSGTALVEGALLGYEGTGIDIDPLSCNISNAKLDILSSDSLYSIQSGVNAILTTREGLFRSQREENRYEFPPWISKKFERWGSQKEKDSYEAEISEWLGVIATIEDKTLRELTQICLSDALTRKFNIRMMGTGVGRFALEISDGSLSRIMEKNLSYTVKAGSICRSLREAFGIQIPTTKVLNESATKLPLENDCIDIVLTSPPYLPASSGREDYLVGKSISITALGLMTPDEIRLKETGSVGSMKAGGNSNGEGLPPSVHELCTWLKNDSLRDIKAAPTYQYYTDLKKALVETKRVLKPDGLAFFVIGKESVFYEFKTRKVLKRVPCDTIFQEIAEQSGLVVDEQIDVELNKKNKNARPRSLDSYYETVFVLRKNR